MSMDYIRRHYGVPAKRGMKVRIVGNEGVRFDAVITGSRGAHLLLRIGGGRRSHQYHPTWNIEYIVTAKGASKS